MARPTQVPVTILTGFLGAGKTTLLNRILSEQHGKRIAVIENEYGEIGIDQALVINADEEVFEMSNGCICCTVRGDLIRILGQLRKRRDKFDYVLVETTGLADPGPVAQTFFMDDEVRDEYTLDGIITVVDAHHVEQQLGRDKECAEQIAFADVVLLNKCDLVSPDRLDALEARIRDMNRLARLHRSVDGNVPVDVVLGLDAFDLDRALVRRPSFLEPEYPFEWTGLFAPSRESRTIELQAGPDPSMRLIAFGAAEPTDIWLRAAAERTVRLFAEAAVDARSGDRLPLDLPVELRLTGEAPFRFELPASDCVSIALFTQHRPEEFSMRTLDAGGHEVTPLLERDWVPAHEHDDTVGSVALEFAGSIDAARFELWIGVLLRERGADIYRMKGFLSLAGRPQRFVFQGVHMLFDCVPEQPWGERPRRNQLVFIGRGLDAAAIESGFRGCLVP
jgi:G3E family GTPase